MGFCAELLVAGRCGGVRLRVWCRLCFLVFMGIDLVLSVGLCYCWLCCLLELIRSVVVFVGLSLLDLCLGGCVGLLFSFRLFPFGLCGVSF